MQQIRFCRVAALVFCAGLPALAAAQAARAPAAAPPPPPPVPQQTTASFADWTLRCNRSAPAAPVCEVVQTISSQDRAVAQIAFGRPGKGQPMHMTVLAPPSVSFSATPALATMRDGDPALVELAWRRCLPGGCLAEGPVADDALRRVRALSDAARITFADGAGRLVALPFSPKGLPQAMDALAREDTN